MTGGPIRVLLADDDQLVRAGIAGILETADDIEVVAQADDGGAAVELARRIRLDVVLLDIRMPRVDGLRALERIQKERPDLPAAMLTTFSDEHLIEAAVALGCLGFVLKSDDPKNLISAVRALAAGGAAFSPAVGRWLVRPQARAAYRRSAQAREAVAALSPRQRDLLAQLSTGRSNAQIAQALSLTPGTVKQYLSTLFDVLGIDNRVQAALIAYEAGND
ncbi:response regulator transcription factor [Kineosporia babensis]|uniref:Response regulator transcription factor n=1 Tax=Kineosporia babensis TaxID=499548 RepID=A0A9X1NG28_9ACTN|nr:response regulator transcription factor [Kineosporia babensis]MCD5314332.1 response regulator transcription factor [Kineosporia babensis]